MKLVSYYLNKEIRYGLLISDSIFDLPENAEAVGLSVPHSMIELLKLEEKGMILARKVEKAIHKGDTKITCLPLKLAPPIHNPPSVRDAYAFRQHVATARKNRGLDMIPEFDEFPVFYFSNHNAICGEGDLYVETGHLPQLDFELEVAAVIGKYGKNITVNRADEYIAGFTIMNDFSARNLQIKEMKLNLGPAKGKDFATAIGPWLVTPDELSENKITTEYGSTFDLGMKAFHNGHQVSSGNMKDMTWTFAQIIERVSYGVEIFPGDIIGSGTVGTGCFLEINGTKKMKAKKKNENYIPVWLTKNDTISLSIEKMGTLTNTIRSMAKES